jgi:hypothetical protein
MNTKEFFINAVPMIDFDGSTSLPTVLFYRPTGRPLIGSSAEIEGSKHPELLLNQDFKVDVGEVRRRSASPRAKFPCADRSARSAVELASDFLYQVLSRVKDWLQANGVAEEVSVLLAEPLSLSEELVQADWLANYRQNLRKIIEGTPGVKHVDFLPEPFAAFQYYRHGLRHPIVAGSGKQYALVIDFGGGTCDVCIIESTKEGDISQTGRNSKPLAANSHPTGGFFINRALTAHLFRRFLSTTPQKKDDRLEKALDAYDRWRRGEFDLPDMSPENRCFISNFQQVLYSVEHVKITLSRQIHTWELDASLHFPVAISLPKDPFASSGERIQATLSATDFRWIFINQIWPRVKSVIVSTLRRGKQELDGARLTVVLLSGGSANIGWLNKLLRRDFSHELEAAEILHASDYQEVVARGLAVECARRFYNDLGDFGSTTYNRLCLLLDPDERGIDLKEFSPRNDRLPALKGISGVLLPSASSLKAFVNVPMRWRVRLDHPPKRRLDYDFMRSVLDPGDLDSLHNIADHTVYTPTGTKFDPAVQVELLVSEDGTAVPTFVYRAGQSERERSAIAGRPFYLDMTFGDTGEAQSAYVGLDFGTSNTAASYIDPRAVETYQRRASEVQWRELGDLASLLPYPIAAPLRHYLGQIDQRGLIKRGREFIESALCIAAYVAYAEYCLGKKGESRIFKGFTQRSAGPLWALLQECLRSLGKNATICTPLRDLTNADFFQPVDNAVTFISQYKHDKIDRSSFALFRPIQILANVCQKVFSSAVFGVFERVSKRRLSTDYEGLFRHACGSSPFIEIWRYKGNQAFSTDQAFVVAKETGTAVPLYPLVFWDECDRHPELDCGHCFVFDGGREGKYSFKAVEFPCTREICIQDEKYSAIASDLDSVRRTDLPIEAVHCNLIVPDRT